ncbi:MAG: two-component regulator propeller domain-containing protein [Planctomycetota bacterium]
MSLRRDHWDMKFMCTVAALLWLSSCSSPAPAPPDATPAPSADHDPYFAESTTISRATGPASITRNILQDRNGHMWFATWEGIIGYDGKTFTNYMNRDRLRRYHTFSVLEDRAGNLWFGTIGAGVYRYDGSSFANFTVRDGLAYDRTGCFAEDSSGLLWIGTERGISLFDGQSFRNLTAANGLLHGDVNSIIEDRQGRMWIGTRGDSYIYDGQSFLPITNQDGLTFQNVRSIIQQENGDILLGGNDGLWRYDGRGYAQLSTRFIGYIYEAANGRIWISAANGDGGYSMALYVLDVSPPPSGDPLTTILDVDGQVFGIVEDVRGDIWFGTERGAIRYDGKSFHYP